MSTLSVQPHESSVGIPEVRHVSASRPLTWLRRGWRDLKRGWPLSLTFGAIFAGLGWLLTSYASGRPHLVMALTTGFLLVAPFLALGFYGISRRFENRHGLHGGNPLLMPFVGVRRNGGSIGLFAVLLAFILSAWERISALLVGLFVRNDVISDGYFSLTMLFDASHAGFVVAYLLFGGTLALLVFALSVVSLPMMLDRRVDMVTAILTSLATVRENPVAMLVWAAIIVAATIVGVMTWFIGLIVVFPLLGHATWHAYRELVERH
jgi:uncharacterized membrane protein